MDYELQSPALFVMNPACALLACFQFVFPRHLMLE